MRLLSVEAITSFTELRKKSMASWKDRQGQLSVTIQHSCLWFYLLVHLHHVTFSRESMTENDAISNCIPSTTVLTGEKQAEPLVQVLTPRNLWASLLVLCNSYVHLVLSVLLNGLLPSELSFAAPGSSLK